MAEGTRVRMCRKPPAFGNANGNGELLQKYKYIEHIITIITIQLNMSIKAAPKGTSKIGLY